MTARQYLTSSFVILTPQVEESTAFCFRFYKNRMLKGRGSFRKQSGITSLELHILLSILSYSSRFGTAFRSNPARSPFIK